MEEAFELEIRYYKISCGAGGLGAVTANQSVKADVTTSAQIAADQAKAAANLTDAQAAAKTAADANSKAAIFVGILSILSSAPLLFFLFGKN
ncbi:Protein of unknown function [Lactobacillus equicursoris DSM 19284 = JCM 14600 = CIP 110162]|uniref:Uncharacterized protein n=1 Tax=Lactobacillus equicursoris DSM 19284 = JCM 14600 = CIP 110162 TaxID=1293597 RepID=K0NWJ1_9LACO|nr:hypothetical protein [Lactobacillus equicursoris]KRL03091.1 hypothetical protein FC20_GL001677 [Lactobacillus equicursoris DSM 19284 = JCM 14600 = CIP 110162]CCK85908.1 Protein of unknown function [Lactobacillus equicursoris DSM 19284 = JCM 14600 = CIP 110162]